MSQRQTQGWAAGGDAPASAAELAPPEWLASWAGAGSFRAVGREFAGHLAMLCDLEPGNRVLDVGCGPGRVAIPLTSHLSAEGSYEGLDILEWAIDWCSEEITSRFPNFRFRVADVRNGQYNPDGAASASEYSFPFAEDEFDLVLAVSVFTHMLPEGVGRYLSEMARVLKPGGRALLTFYLLNNESLALIEAGDKLKPAFRFAHSLGECRVAFPDAPEWAVAYEEGFVLGMCEASGLTLREEVRYGRWCGRKRFLSWQDVVVVERG